LIVYYIISILYRKKERMSLAEQVKALKIHLERSVEAANRILELIYIESESDEEKEASSESDYASTEELECYVPPAPVLVRCETYVNERLGTPEMLGPAKVYKKIEVERFDE
jgi:hypothetical protein